MTSNVDFEMTMKVRLQLIERMDKKFERLERLMDAQFVASNKRVDELIARVVELEN